MFHARSVFVTVKFSVSRGEKAQHACVISEYTGLDKVSISWALSMNIYLHSNGRNAYLHLKFMFYYGFYNNFLHIDFNVSNFSAAYSNFHRG